MCYSVTLNAVSYLIAGRFGLAQLKQNKKKLKLAQSFAARRKFDCISAALINPTWLAVKDLKIHRPNYHEQLLTFK